MIKETGKFIFAQVSDLIGKQYARFHYKRYATLCQKHNIAPLPKDIEKAYIKKWEVLAKKVDTNNLRLFAHYVGMDLNIVPEDIVHNVIEQILNPPLYRAYYIDKNMADKIYPKGSLPTTLFRKIHGFFFDADYNPIPQLTAEILSRFCNEYDKIILKPTVGTNSGVGVELFTRKGDTFYNTKQEKLDLAYLEKSGSDYILQECLVQSEFMAQFNSSSINTFRVLAYRSVVTNEVKILNVGIRIGRKGSYLDNSHAGGIVVGISTKGELNKVCHDIQGNSYPQFNSISFESASFIVPQFDRVLSFAKEMAQCIPHHRSLNLDLMIDKNGNPRLIECNFEGMSVRLYQFNIGAIFGSCTDEVIEYCAKNLDRINRIHVIY